MAKDISRLLEEADQIIVGRSTSVKEASKAEEDDVFKLAELVRRGPQETKQASTHQEEEEDFPFTLREKIAHAAAIMDTWRNLPVLAKIAEFEKKARDEGHSDEEIQQFFEKNASSFQIKSILQE